MSGAALAVMLCASLASAAQLTFSIGIRETGTAAAIGADGGTANGIEFIDQDLHDVELDGTWQQVSINLANPQSVTAFAGATANSIIDGNRGTLEHIRIRNTDGITNPINLYLDDLVYTDASGTPHLLGWEGLNVGDEVRFQEPNFSGSTSANLVAGGTAAVSEDEAFSGTQSYELDFQFIDDTDTRWVRLTTFASGGMIGPNATIEFNGVLSFYVNGTAIPEPTAASLLALTAIGGLLVRRRG
jgi:hypothetical protein